MRVCAGGLLTRGDEILLARRSADRAFYPGVWDILGGHCEAEETPADTLVRELQEEVGVTVRTFEEIAVLGEPDPTTHGEARYHIFIVTAWDGGEPRLLGSEHSELRWLSLGRALDLPLAHPAHGELFETMLGRGRTSSTRRSQRCSTWSSRVSRTVIQHRCTGGFEIGAGSPPRA